ncbi:hypothetical protein ACGFIJ_25645, partial [Microbispora bryophytorum]
MKYRLIDAEKTRYGVSLLARVLGVSRQGHYAWKNRGPSARARQDEALTDDTGHVPLSGVTPADRVRVGELCRNVVTMTRPGR